MKFLRNIFIAGTNENSTFKLLKSVRESACKASETETTCSFKPVVGLQKTCRGKNSLNKSMLLNSLLTLITLFRKHMVSVLG